MEIKLPPAHLHSRLLIGSAILTSLGVASPALAQETFEQSWSLEEVVVTATKRDEMVQDVPVAVTAITADSMEVNQVVDVNDLSGLAPNMTVRAATGGTNTPAFNMRGITSIGIVAGSDKQISVYLDGVYIGAPQGSIFQLPDIQQLEVLRGPQGTLFGRNATGGAISIATRAPSGELGFRQKVTAGSRDLLGTETTIDLPAVGPFSMYFTYAQEKQDGDIKNLGAGTFWDRSSFGYGTDTSPKTLGEKDMDSFFLSALLEPSDIFSLAYKFDYSTDKGSPAGNALVGRTNADSLPGVGAIVNGLIADNPQFQTTGKTRPDSTNNAWATHRDQKVQGHNLTALWTIDDSLSLKNTLGYRKSEVYAPSDISGTSGWVVGPNAAAAGAELTTLIQTIYGADAGPILAQAGLPMPPLGTAFCFICSQPGADGDQWSNEVQLDWDTDAVTVVGGLLFYKSEDTSGSPPNSTSTFQLSYFPGHIVPVSTQAISYNDAKSYAAFSQASFHATDELDLLAGLRYTRDEKSGDFVTGLNGAYTHRPFDYDDDQISYLLGLNYKLSEDILAYIKYSTAYVSGGSVAGFEFDPEEVKSLEIGSKAEFLDGHLRTNIAVFDATYEHLQSPQSGQNIPGAEGISVLVIEGGDLSVQGVELEVTALPIPGLTISSGIGYQDVEYDKVSDLSLTSVQANPALPSYLPGSTFEPTLAPDFTGNLSINYETAPLFESAYMAFGVTGTWHDEILLEPNTARAELYDIGSTPATWVVNARAALKEVDIGKDLKGEVALWGRNLTDDDNLNFSTNFGAFVSGTFQEERSYGIDLIVNY